MKQEGFINPVEMTDGLESIPSVEQLVFLIEKDECSITKSIAEATRRWSTVATVLTATQNIDCLRQFIKLGGVRFLDSWLQEAQRCNIDDSDKLVEDLISAVLGALVKLPMDQEGLKACGIGNTVKHFHSHRNMEIQGKAKLLSDGWEKLIEMKIEMKIENGICYDYGGTTKTALVEVAERSNCESTNTSFQGFLGEDCGKEDASGCKSQHSASSSANSNNKISSLKKVTGDRRSFGAEVPKHSLEGIASIANISVESGMSLVTRKSSNPTESEELGVSERKNCQKKTNASGSISIVKADLKDRLRTLPISSYSKAVPSSVSCSNDGCQKASVEANSSAIDKKSNKESTAKNVSLEMAEDGSLNYWKNIMKQQPEKQTDSYITSQVIKNVSVPFRGKLENLGKTSEDVESYRADNVGKLLQSGLGTNAEEKPAITGKIEVPIQKWGQKNAELLTGKDMEMELTYELDDALEVARRVAKEVEREVGIYREASGSSSSVEDRNCKTMLLSNADSAELKRSARLKEIGDRSESHSCCSMKEEMDEETSTGNGQLCSGVKDPSQGMSAKVPETDDGLHEQESSQLTTVPEAHLAVNERRYLPSFDLNEDVQTEEVECTEKSVTTTPSSCHVTNLSAPIPVVATSRGPACLPTTPLHFEGELGWRGSAATSAFRPALLCKTHDKEKAGSIEENDCSSKGFRGIDLNIADAGDDSVVELFPKKLVPGFSTLPSGDSSAEVNSRKAERLNLDLNRLSDNDDNCPDLLSDWRTEYKLHPGRNGAHSPSPSSSSRPSIRDFDLNDNLSFSEAHDVHRPVHGIWPSRNRALDDRASSITGSTMYLEPKNVKSACWADLGSVQDSGHGYGRKEFLYSAQPFLMAGRNTIPSVEQMGRVVAVQPTLPYAQPPGLSYNGFGMGPTFPLPSAVYPSGVVPYMVDSRGAAILPQILGPGTLSSFPRASYLDVSGTPGTNDVGIVRPNFNLNVGVTSLETEVRGGNVRHLFFPANGNSLMEEQTKSFQQAAITGPSMKRKEPECGWESYQVGYKQMTSWH